MQQIRGSKGSDCHQGFSEVSLRKRGRLGTLRHMTYEVVAFVSCMVLFGIAWYSCVAFEHWSPEILPDMYNCHVLIQGTLFHVGLLAASIYLLHCTLCELCWVLFYSIMSNVLGPAIWIDGFANFGYISESSIDLLGPGQHLFHSVKRSCQSEFAALTCENCSIGNIIGTLETSLEHWKHHWTNKGWEN